MEMKPVVPARLHTNNGMVGGKVAKTALAEAARAPEASLLLQLAW